MQIGNRNFIASLCGPILPLSATQPPPIPPPPSIDSPSPSLQVVIISSVVRSSKYFTTRCRGQGGKGMRGWRSEWVRQRRRDPLCVESINETAARCSVAHFYSYRCAISLINSSLYLFLIFTILKMACNYSSNDLIIPLLRTTACCVICAVRNWCFYFFIPSLRIRICE